MKLLNIIKRLIDILVSTFGLLAFSPIFLIIIGLELFFHGWPPFFIQSRLGLHERIFKIIKFRSMTNKRGLDGKLLSDAERLTTFGWFLRSTSLDEIPNLLNVLRGEMSLVGPRPIPTHEYHQKTCRHEMRPGITGWAQVSGRNLISLKEKRAYDVYYVNNWSLWFDFKILLKTINRVLTRHGINEKDVTMTEFMGNN